MQDPGEILSLSAYYDALLRFDWDYESTDDFSVWRRESRRRAELERLAFTSREHEELFRAFDRHGKDGPRSAHLLPARPA